MLSVLNVMATHDFEMTRLNDWAFEVMVDACSVLDEYWIADGTVLGAYRDDAFLPGDHDIDLGIMAYDNMKYDLPVRFLKKGFILGRFTEIDDKMQQFVFTKFGNIVDIWVWYEKGDMMECVTELGLAKQPMSLFNPLGEYEWKGEKFKAPNDMEGYLEMRFKNWETPDYGKRWDEYTDFLTQPVSSKNGIHRES